MHGSPTEPASPAWAVWPAALCLSVLICKMGVSSDPAPQGEDCMVRERWCDTKASRCSRSVLSLNAFSVSPAYPEPVTMSLLIGHMVQSWGPQLGRRELPWSEARQAPALPPADHPSSLLSLAFRGMWMRVTPLQACRGQRAGGLWSTGCCVNAWVPASPVNRRPGCDSAQQINP